MGTGCIKEKSSQAPTYQNSKIQMPSHQMINSAFSGFSCPIENLDILEKKKQIDENYPFSVGQKLKTTRDLSEPNWRKITISSDPKNKYWFFSMEKKTKAHGYGVLYFLSKYGQCTVQGQFSNNSIIAGENYIKIFKDGSAYMGTLNQDFKLHGKGQLIKPNKQKYAGQFFNGLFHGEGEYTTKYHKFVGKFENGEKVKGIQQEKHIKYEGTFENNLKEGQGIQIGDNGLKYIGNFSKNKRNGYGELFDSAGKILYTGMWNNGQKQGK